MTATAKHGTRKPKARLPFDRRKYGRLLARTLPTVIGSEAEYKRAVTEIERLVRKGEALSRVEQHEDRTEE